MKSRRFGFRHALPVIESVLYFILWTTGAATDTWRTEVVPDDSAQPHLVYVQESSYRWEPQKPPSFSAPTKLAISLNLPAFILAALICDAFHRQSLMLLFYTSGLLALPLWYFIGRWIDRAVGLLPAGRRRGRVVGVHIWTFAGLSLAILGLSIFAATVHRHSADRFVAVAFVVWSSVFAVLMVCTATKRLAFTRKYRQAFDDE